jgi:hypothetical protein
MTPMVEQAVVRGHNVRFTFDPESNNWSFRVPGLNIVGGGETRQQAESVAGKAIHFALQEPKAQGYSWRLLVGLGAVGALAPVAIRFIGNSFRRLAGIR